MDTDRHGFFSRVAFGADEACQLRGVVIGCRSVVAIDFGRIVTGPGIDSPGRWTWALRENPFPNQTPGHASKRSRRCWVAERL